MRSLEGPVHDSRGKINEAANNYPGSDPVTDSNPYATPKAELRGPGTTGGRPGWVWAIFIFYMLSAVGTLFSFYFVFSGAIKLPEEQRQYIESLTVFDHAMTVILMGINVVAAVQLFRLRKISVYLFPSALALGVLLTVWHAATKGWLAASGGSGVTSMMFGWGIAVAICLYTWRLARRGILK